MSYFETLKIIDKLKQKYPNIITKEDICNATKNRQLALIEQAKDADLIVIAAGANQKEGNSFRASRKSQRKG